MQVNSNKETRKIIINGDIRIQFYFSYFVKALPSKKKMATTAKRSKRCITRYLCIFGNCFFLMQNITNTWRTRP